MDKKHEDKSSNNTNDKKGTVHNKGTENKRKDIMDEKHGDKSSDNTNDKKGTVHNKGTDMANKKNYGFKAITARELQDFVPTQKNFIVDGLVTHGLNLLAGPKKHGKSMLVLNLALCITGKEDFLGRKTEHGVALYMALEDTKKRLQDRLNTMVDYEDATKSLLITNSVEYKGQELIKGLELYLQDYPNITTIIIDVLQKIRASKPAGQSEYAYDYNEIGDLKNFADRHGIAIVLVTHCRKTKDRNDWVNEIAGGVGVTGAADTILMLEKNRGKGSLDGRLLITGRDMPEDELPLCFAPEHFKWHYVGTKEDQEAKKHGELYKSSPVARTVKLLLERNNGTWSGTCKEILDFGLKELGESIAKNESALARKINSFDGLLLDDGIIHTRPAPNGGVAGRIHHFKLEKPTQEAQAQPEEEDGLQFDEEPEDYGAPQFDEEPEDYESPSLDWKPEDFKELQLLQSDEEPEDYESPSLDWKPEEDGELPFGGEPEEDGELPFY